MNYNTPLYNALKTYSKKRKIPFHMPGHKLGKGIADRFKGEIFNIDLTELRETDDLHAPEGPIKEAQRLAAKAFGAWHTFFLVNGSTCGIQTMVAGICNPGDVLIVDRNCHSSVIHALILCGVSPYYIYPEYIPKLGVAGGMNPQRVEEALKRYPQAKGVFITCPTYYGICSDMKTIANIVHRYNKVLMVDEAHGAHFCFHPGLPLGALRSGADMCVQSAHKTLPALTQSALLHVNSDRIDLHRIKKCLKMFQTSSPSFVLMAYLDAARSIMECNGNELLSDLIRWCQQARESINQSKQLYCLGSELAGSHQIQSVDCTRMVVNVCNTGLSGYQVERELYTFGDIQVEMSDMNNILCIPSPGNSEEQLMALVHSLKAIISDIVVENNARVVGKYCDSQYSMSPAHAFYSESKVVNLRDAVGEVCSDMITCYPPGIPVLCPGEMISGDIAEYILCVKNAGGKVTGMADERNIRVIKNL
ncbi:aminotransferase class I/II-fold pyridoxal phosphate-dependent enzyme [Petroclostridium sp. X23]|uniref:aminotransferase class I/II-fold pyridoxal phosphate-dependent enzyme n=1 Tax=Petroclostridium sp. X23 TaxID=3045146 RepID=UPI0024AD75C8|nr:aminotransferase class I/II-fold pyridoxal phosphate-dependent enzyme [Petroclostridium sp. X23]WHH57073.1 aminotransferase class I/II-fold pyridoxal phosphate-dependent enzyme [Petroclostridium sp. X23]